MAGNTFRLVGGKIKIVKSGPVTRRLLIVGTAVDGPTNEFTQVSEPSQIEAKFGPAKYTGDYLDSNGVASGKPNGATIPLAVQTALAAGAGDIAVTRASGVKATNATAFTSKLDIESVYGGNIYNQVSVVSAVATANVTITIVQPQSKGGSAVFAFTNANTIEEVIDTLNNSPKNKTIYIHPTTFPAVLTSSATALGSATAALTGGANETSAPGEAFYNNTVAYATRLATAETGTFDVLFNERWPFDVSVLTGIYLDSEAVASDPSVSIAYDFAAWIENCSREARPCLGVIGLRPTNLRTTEEMIAYANDNLLATVTGYYNTTLKWLKAGPFMNNRFTVTPGDGTQLDLGGRLVVTATDAIHNHPQVGSYIDNIHVALAAQMTATAPERGLTLQPLAGVAGFPNIMPGQYAKLLANGVGFSAANDLSGNGAYVVAVRDTYNPQGPRVILEEATASARDDYLRNAQIVRLVNAIQADIALVTRSYFGTTVSEVMKMAVSRDIKNVLDGYAQEGAFVGGEGSGYNFKVSTKGTDAILGILRIELEVTPASTLQRVVQTLYIKQPAA